MDFWISVWISADGVRDFFRDGPLERGSMKTAAILFIWPRIVVDDIMKGTPTDERH